MTGSISTSQPTPFRQIRAHHDDYTITLYQAYNTEIASAAVAEQKLSASKAFSTTRMTWVKPSWCWMMYRSGYSFKDKGQERILAIKMRHESFRRLLMEAGVCDPKLQKMKNEERNRDVRVQWDPERGPRLQKRDWRSIQIGISGLTAEWWVGEGILRIEDVTEMAVGMMEAVKGEGGKELTQKELEEKGLWLKETVYEVDDELRRVLKMDEKENE